MYYAAKECAQKMIRGSHHQPYNGKCLSPKGLCRLDFCNAEQVRTGGYGAHRALYGPTAPEVDN